MGGVGGGEVSFETLHFFEDHPPLHGKINDQSVCRTRPREDCWQSVNHVSLISGRDNEVRYFRLEGNWTRHGWRTMRRKTHLARETPSSSLPVRPSAPCPSPLEISFVSFFCSVGAKGVYHLARKSGSFGLKTNGKVIFRKFRLEIVEYLQR